MANREEEISITSLVEKAEGIKDLIDKVAGDVISNGSQFIHNLGHAQGYPYHILILREPRRVRLGDLHYSPRPLGMLGKRTPAPGTSLANAAVTGAFSAEQFLPSFLKSMCACSHIFTNFAVAEPLSLEVCGLSCQEPSSVSFLR